MTQITIGVILKESFSSRNAKWQSVSDLSEVSIDPKNILN
jgi:hypothetical protein